MSSRPDLRLDWCSHAAAKYAVEHWHYSKRLPSGKLTRIGAWEGGDFIGCVLFGRGNNNNMAQRYGLPQTEAAELTRVALTNHVAPTSRIVARAVHLLRRFSPGLRLLVSYADPDQGHHGGIYQAMNWVYVGSSVPQRELLVAGHWMHKRSASAKWGTAAPQRIRELTGLDVSYGPEAWKHTYLYPLDDAMRKQIAPLAKPYPKRGRGETDNAPQPNAESGGASPTRPLLAPTEAT